MPGSTRAGDLLTGRYRLVDLLSEARGGRFWRAWDTVLSRHVAVHLIPEGDERAEALMEAARRSATLFDPHLLRVLDADHADGMVFVVNEWGEGESLDHLLADQPLSPRRAAWLTAEVGSMLVTAHEQGIAHGRLVPENVLIDETGAVKVIGFACDAALNGIVEGRISTDVVDLAAVLYAALTGKWPGISRSAVPAAPQEHGRPLRPRQVRAGVPRTLDALCDEVLSPYLTGADHGFDSAGAIVAALEEYVGDLAAVAEAEARSHRGNTSPRIPRIDAPLALAPEISAAAAAAAAAGTGPATDTGTGAAAVTTNGAGDAPAELPTDTPPVGPAGPVAPGTPPAPDDAPDLPGDGTVAMSALAPDVDERGAAPQDATDLEGSDSGPAAPVATEPEGPPDQAPASSPEAATAPAEEVPAHTPDGPGDQTQAEAPVFDDGDDAEWSSGAWMTARSDPAPPPPPFDEAPERPLFAPDPPEGRAARVPRSPAPDTHGGTGAGYWPWGNDSGTLPPAPPEEDDEADGRVPGRSSLRIAALIALAAVVLLAMVYAFNRGRDSGSDDASPQQPTRTPTTSAPSEQPFRIAGVQDFDPYGDPPEENPELAPLAIDGKADTAWVSNRYDQQFGPGGLKPGVGLLVDLGQARDVGSVDVTLQGSPTTVELLGTTDEAAPTGIDGLDELASGEATGTEVTLEPEKPTSARWLVVWLTRAPDVGGGFRGAVAEIAVNP
ncbi:protein kinase domain-containing protein [Nocardioides guangzhouensis]|uniref:protein kinase domain-containing protein n=1 Tax=Nocardioides guangzhouensis TaxID=2497878 RepID=UPI0014383036|nr:hypothetical protein [Nocardioides guangzhouensis]